MTALPVREIVLYKHGVGFFVRAGEVSGESVALTFKQAEINDILKSLAVFDRAGGQVLGIHYQTPLDKEALLASCSIDLSKEGSLRDLVTGLRGRQVEIVQQRGPETLELIKGVMIGLDAPLTYMESTGGLVRDTASVSVLTDLGVRTLRLHDVEQLRVIDPQAAQDLNYFLNMSRSEDDRRTVQVQLSAGEHDLAVYYVAPSPTWRVSYRLVAESNPDGTTGKALLQGWGLFDNRLDEDLEAVKVTLVAGQPISFVYDLYESRIPERPLVKDESRVAPGPIEYEAIAMEEPSPMELERARGVALSKRLPVAGQIASSDYVSRFAPAQAAQSMKPTAEARDTGETFQYAVTTPVSVKRGESALVPIIGSELEYERELLYNGNKFAGHPVAALRFSNTTGLTLERGPVTLVENGDYKGEAIIPFSKDGAGVYLPYAVELGVRVKEDSRYETVTTGLTIKDAHFIFEQYQTSTRSYTLENTTAKPVTVLVEGEISPQWDLYDSPAPDVTTLENRRWKVAVKPHGRAELVIRHRFKLVEHEEVRSLNKRRLAEFVRHNWLAAGAIQPLERMLDALGQIDAARSKQDDLDQQRDARYEEQSHLRENLTALSSDGPEAPLRLRMLTQLEQSQDVLDAIARQRADLDAQIAAAEAEVEQIIAGLG
ncbi:MAG TPA: hypothetical protein PLQ56_21260 [Aggregatilineales bacterium]|nr:hypothetical protein [Aggregatilineales bacterium]